MIKNLEIYNEGISKVLKVNNLDTLRGKTILITGANGLIGSAIIDILNYLNVHEDYGMKIIAIVRNRLNILERMKKYEKLVIVEQDITQEMKYNEKVDYIIHAASNANPMRFSQDPVGTMLGNFIGMNQICKFAKEHNCKRVEYISSGEVYGEGDKDVEKFEENYIGKINSMNVRSCYPLSKLASETLGISYSEQYNIECVIARPCHTFGPTQTESDSRASAQFIRNVLNDEDIIMKSEGLQLRSYCYVLDCAIGILLILIKGKNSNAYNIANKNSIVTIREMAEIIAQKANKKVIFDTPSQVEKRGYNPITKSILDGSKLEQLGWTPCYDFEEGIEETLKIMK